MEATLIHAIADPHRLEDAVRSVREELAPGFLANPGARHGYWMAQPGTGRLLILNLWDDGASMRAAAAVEGARRATVADRVGVRIMAVHHMEALGAHEEALDESPSIRWVRATWVSGLRSGQRRAISPLYREAVPDQARTCGFRASYWLADLDLGTGLGISCWEGPAETRDGEVSSRQRRRRLESVLGCTVVSVQEFEALGVAMTAAVRRPARRGGPVGRVPDNVRTRGTVLERPPGALLAVRGKPTDQVVVVVDGAVGLALGDRLDQLGPGHHFGGRRLLHRERHLCNVLATSRVRLQVISRREFHDIEHDAPSDAAELVHADAEPADPLA
jgi:hypothetical protein